MKIEQVHNKLDELLKNPKSKNFLNHLVKSYLPISNTKKVMVKPSSDFKCAITGVDLISVNEIMDELNVINSKLKVDTNLTPSIKTTFDENGDFTPETLEIIGNKKIGVTGKDTRTYMSIQASQEFFKWVTIKVLEGDKHINWLMLSIKHYNSVKKPEVKKEIKKVVEKNDGRAKYQIGDLNDSLSKLKIKLEKEGK